MRLETILWILLISVITYKYDINLLDSINKMSDNDDFIILSFLIVCWFFFFFKIFIPEKIQKLNESLIWISFITVISASCRNELGEDIDTFEFLFFSLNLLYIIYIYRLLYPKEETFIIQKIIIVNLIVLKIFWPTIIYLWPYGEDYPDNFDWTGWPDINL